MAHDDTYLGTRFYAEPGNAYPDLGAFVSTGTGPAGNENGTMMGYRATTADGIEDLVAMWTGPDHVLVDAIRLTGNTSEVRLVLSCEPAAVVLVPATSVQGGGFHGDWDEVLRSWQPEPGGVLEEFDPSTLQPTGTC